MNRVTDIKGRLDCSSTIETSGLWFVTMLKCRP